jgi:hypothetical protein
MAWIGFEYILPKTCREVEVLKYFAKSTKNVFLENDKYRVTYFELHIKVWPEY